MIPLPVVMVVPVRTLTVETFTAVTVMMDLREMVQVLVMVLSPVLVGSICHITQYGSTVYIGMAMGGSAL